VSETFNRGCVEYRPETGAAAADEPPEHVVGPRPESGDLDVWCAWQPLNDLGNAQRFIARHGENLSWLEGSGWLTWDGKRWSREAGKRSAHVVAQETVTSLCGEADAVKASHSERHDKLIGWCRESGSSGKIAALQREAQPHLVRQPDEMDSHAQLLTCANGTLELGPRVLLREHRREDLMTRLVPIDFEDAQAPVFERFMEIIQPDSAVRDFLYRWFGYCLTGATSEQVIVMLHGLGSNGKSTLLACLAHVLADFVQPLPFTSFIKNDRRGGGDATPDLALLPGARLVTAAEPETGARLSESIIKSITGGERLTVRHLNQGFFDFAPQFKVTLAFNNRPSTRGQDEGLWRRLCLVPFTQKVGPAEVGPVLEALEVEGPGILALLVRSCEAYHRDGLQVPEAIRAATNDYRTDMDPVGRFLLEWCRTGEAYQAATMPASRLWEAWVQWGKENAEDPGTKNLFGRRLTERGIKRGRPAGLKGYLGVQLNDEGEEALARAKTNSDPLTDS
jgi:putative DNA primase/helicase